MNYEFHVGDYVETWSGVSGHISKFEKWRHPAFIEDSVWFVYTTKKGNSYYFESEVSQLKYEFRRIGSYDFTKKEKKKIEQLDKDLPVEGKYKDKKVMIKQYLDDGYYTLVYNDKMIDKINELVDVVNKLMDKEDVE